jgi:hypothetical protein
LIKLAVLLAAPFHFPKLLTVAPAVLVSRFPFQIPAEVLVINAIGPILFTLAL